VLQVDQVERATVIPPGGYEPAGTATEIGDAPDRFIRETMRETGCSEEEARLEWKILLADAHGERPAGWMQE
jgi:hypothetical protein